MPLFSFHGWWHWEYSVFTDGLLAEMWEENCKQQFASHVFLYHSSLAALSVWRGIQEAVEMGSLFLLPGTVLERHELRCSLWPEIMKAIKNRIAGVPHLSPWSTESGRSQCGDNPTAASGECRKDSIVPSLWMDWDHCWVAPWWLPTTQCPGFFEC